VLRNKASSKLQTVSLKELLRNFRDLVSTVSSARSDINSNQSSIIGSVDLHVVHIKSTDLNFIKLHKRKTYLSSSI
jgi:hypothetical protein